MEKAVEKTLLKSLLEMLRLFLYAIFFSFVFFFFITSVYYKGNFIKGIGLEFNIVQTNSMQGEINQYDFIVLRRTDPKSVRVGDIVAFYDNTMRYKILHRVINIINSEDGWLFQTKGDNSITVDAGYRLESNIYAMYWFKIPLLGVIITFFRSQYGLLVIGFNIWNFMLLFFLWKMEEKENTVK